jgi:hypothetical protein
MTHIFDPTIDNCKTISLGNGLEQWKLLKYNTYGDGNCLFHAILNSFFKAYHNEKIEDLKISRLAMVRKLRKELAQELPKYYDKLAGGKLKEFAQEIPEYRLANMIKTLDSDDFIGYGYIEFIGDLLNKDIYILDGYRSTIYVSDELKFCIKGNRPSIILYYADMHYDLIGLSVDDIGSITHFDADSDIIKFLYEQVGKIVNK